MSSTFRGMHIFDDPTYTIETANPVKAVEFSPYERSSNVVFVAFPTRVSVASLRFEEESNKVVDLDILKTYNLPLNPQVLAVGSETQITSSVWTVQFACTCADFNIYIVEDDLVKKVLGSNDEGNLKVLSGHKRHINDIMFGKNSYNDVLASVSDDLTCRIWNVRTEECSGVYHLCSPGMSVKLCCEQDQPLRVLVAEKEGIIRIYSHPHHIPILSYNTFIMPLIDADWSSDYSKVSAVAGNCLFVWDVKKPSAPVYERSMHPDGTRIVRFNKQNDTVVATLGYPAHTITIMSLRKELPLAHAQTKVATNITWHQHLPLICTGAGRRLFIWKVLTG